MTKQISKIDIIVADSSFYVCFLNDIRRGNSLLRILTQLRFYVPLCVHAEVSKSNDFDSIIRSSKAIRLDTTFNFADILRPFVSKKQFEKGETESIALAFILLRMNVLDKLILDDSDARVFVINNLSTLSKFMTGTVGFMADCCCQYCFFTKEEVTDILKLIEVSGFRVDNNVLNRVRNRVSEC